MVKTAAAKPGMESFEAKPKELNCATEEGWVVVEEDSQLLSITVKIPINMYKNLRISIFFCTFAAAKVNNQLAISNNQ